MQAFYDLGGTTPPMESCAQVGQDDYHERARKEARAYIAQLHRVLGPEPPNVRLTIKSHPHDFGNYLTVIVYYDGVDSAACAYAQRCESGEIDEWDHIARVELGLLPDSSSSPVQPQSERRL